MTEYSALTALAIQAALRAGSELKKGFEGALSIEHKSGKHNLVTQYDLISEEIITSMIEKTFPSHSILAEEGGEKNNHDEITWIIDPLDGTVNFAHGIPIFSISIAASIKEDILCGIVYQPLLSELFIAEKGKGATLNGRPLRVSSQKNFEEAFLATGFPYHVDTNPLGCIDHICAGLHLGLPIRRLGSAALDLCYTAAGRYDGYFEASLKPWDLAAGKLIVQEAGGNVSTYDGDKRRLYSDGSVLATNGHLHSRIIQFLKDRK